MQDHLNDLGTLSTAYQNDFDSVMQNDLCPNIAYLSNTTNLNCSDFSSGSYSEGLHVTTVRYFSTLRDQLNNYQINRDGTNVTAITDAFNDDGFFELCKCLYHYNTQMSRNTSSCNSSGGN